MNGWLEQVEQVRHWLTDQADRAMAAGAWTDVPIAAGLLVCLVVALSVRRRRRTPEPAGQGPPAGARASSLVREDDAARAKAAVAALIAALRAPARTKSGALARAVRLEEQGSHLSEAAVAVAALGRGGFGSGRPADLALTALAAGDLGPIRELLTAAAADPATSGHLAAVWLVEDAGRALEPARRAVALAPRSLAAWSVLAVTAIEAQALDEARDACEAVLKLGTGLADRSKVGGALGILGEVYHARGALDRAQDYLSIALTYQAGLACPDSMIRLYLQLCRIHEARSDWDRAADTLSRALALDSPTGRPDAVADLELRAGELARRRGRLPDACGHWVRARQLFQAQGQSARAEEIEALIAAALRGGAPAP